MNPLALPPKFHTVLIDTIDTRPGDAMVFSGHASGSVSDGERAIIWRAPNGQHVVTVGFIDDHPWSPVHKTSVLLCNEAGAPSSGQPQPGSALGIIDHRTAAETWWKLTAPAREKWRLALDVLDHMPTDEQHRPTLPVTHELEATLRLTLPWIPKPCWPEWCRRLYATKAGMVVHADGRGFTTPLGTAPPAAMIEGSL